LHENAAGAGWGGAWRARNDELMAETKDGSEPGNEELDGDGQAERS